MYSGITIIYYRKTVGHNTVAKHIPPRWKSRPLPLRGSSVPEHSVTRTLDRTHVWKWPPRSPDITPCNSVLRGYVKDRVFNPPLPHYLTDLKTQIIAAVKNIDAPMLTRVWQELDFHINVCHVTHGAHIENL